MYNKVGFLLFLIGAAGMDSQNQTIPAVMVAIGLVILITAALKEKSLAQPRPKNCTRQEKLLHVNFNTEKRRAQ